jgi:hypothetical protein
MPNTPPPAPPARPLTRRELRESRGVSRLQAAAAANTTESTIRIYELDPLEVKDPAKRAAIDEVYRELASATPRLRIRASAWRGGR